MSADWRDRGRCAEVDPELFFPTKGKPGKEAKRICASCEVRVQCLAWALSLPEQPQGVWGGLDERERHLWRSAPAGAPRPVTARQAARNRARLEAGLRDVANARRTAA